MRLQLSERQLRTRGGVLDEILENVFDAAILLDRDGEIVYNSDGSLRLRNFKREDVVGRHISEISDWPIFQEVLDSGKAQIGIVVTLDGKKCITNVYPVYDGDMVIGLLGTILFRNITALKNVIAGVMDDIGEGSESMYDMLARVETSYTFKDFIGESIAAKELLEQCRKASMSTRAVLLVGETGTGKEILASAIHSGRTGKTWSPFVKINCSAIPQDLLESELFGHEKGAFTGASSLKKGKFELAAGGSILLDEIGEMDLRMQSKLLRVLEEKEFERVGGTKMLPLNARVIASTNANLAGKVALGEFRPDLYYRLGALEIYVPPLRERVADIPMLVRHFIEKDQLGIRIEASEMELFLRYPWPGNVRQLRNVLNRLDIMCAQRLIKAADIQSILTGGPVVRATPLYTENPPGTYGDANAMDRERDELLRALKLSGNNISKAAKALGVCRATFYNRLHRCGISPRA